MTVPDPSPQPTSSVSVDSFLLRTAELLHRYGTPSHRLERVMTQVSETLGVKGVYLYTPTALVISLAHSGHEKTYLRRVDSGPLDVSKLIRFDEILEQLEEGELSLEKADAMLAEAERAAPPFGHWMTSLAYAAACASVGILIGGNAVEVVMAGLFGLLLYQFERLTSRATWERGTLEPLSGALAALAALLVARYVIPIDDRLVTLASLIVLLPGLSLTVGMTELAVGHWNAGVARSAGAAVTLLALVLGVALAWRLGADLRNLPQAVQWSLPSWAPWLAILVAPSAFAILFRANVPQWPVIYGVSVTGVLASQWASARYGVEFGSLLGAMVVGCGSNAYARIRNRPALIPLTPGMLILVPGAIGYRSMTALLENQTMLGVEFAFRMLMVAISLVGGLLAANLVLPPKRIL